MSQSLRPGMEMNHEELCRQARRTIQESPYTQRAIAETLGVDESSVSRACNEPGPTFQRLQCSIIETVTGLRVEKRVHFVTRSQS